MQLILGIITGVFMSLAAVYFLPNTFWKLRTKFRELDYVHLVLLLAFLCMAGFAWYCSMQRDQAVKQANLVRQEYFKARAQSQIEPPRLHEK